MTQTMQISHPQLELIRACLLGQLTWEGMANEQEQ